MVIMVKKEHYIIMNDMKDVCSNWPTKSVTILIFSYVHVAENSSLAPYCPLNRYTV